MNPLTLALVLAFQVQPPAGLAPGDRLAADFNAAKGDVRLLFIWAPS